MGIAKTKKESIRILHEAIDGGITFIDKYSTTACDLKVEMTYGLEKTASEGVTAVNLTWRTGG